MSESPEDMISRVRMMSEDDGCTWDLSPNDQAALKYVLSELKKVQSSHEAELMAIVEQAASETCMATNSFTCRKAGGNCSHQRARELLNKIKGEG